jgi:hypothetical protein
MSNDSDEIWIFIVSEKNTNKIIKCQNDQSRYADKSSYGRTDTNVW